MCSVLLCEEKKAVVGRSLSFWFFLVLFLSVNCCGICAYLNL